MDFMHFHGFICISNDFMRFHEISWISGVGGFAASATLCRRDDAPKETFTRSQLAAISSLLMNFQSSIRFMISMNFRGPKFADLRKRVAAPVVERRTEGSKDIPDARRTGEVLSLIHI